MKLFKWEPKKDLAAVAVSWLLVVGSLSIATFVVTPENGGLYFIFYGIAGALIFGVVFPMWWTVVKSRRPLSDLGIKMKNLAVSLAFQAVFATALYFFAFREVDFPGISLLLPLASLAIAIGFFEAVFWRGWVQSRIEDSFGIIPGILLGSILYALYHIGYGMPWSELRFLFFIGVMYGLTFRFTRNILILFPVFQPMGQMITLIKDKLFLPPIAALGFVEVFLAMLGAVFVFTKLSGKNPKAKK